MSTSLTRRSFAGSLALAALAPTFGVRPDLPLGAPSLGFLPDAGAPTNPGPLARALAGAIRAQYGARLTRTELATITQQIQSGLDRAAQIRKMELPNGAEPDVAFSAMPEDTGAP